MPIRFLCQQCGTPLSIARRKAGASIDCPKCGYTQIVPTESAVESATSADLRDEAEELDADEPEAIILPEGSYEVESLDAEADLASVEAESPSTACGRAVVEGLLQHQPDRVSDEMLLVSRRVIYAQGALIAVVGVIALIAGYWIGHGVAPSDSSDAGAAAEAEPVVVEGQLLYRPADRVEGDEKAVAIFLPQDRTPPSLIETAGIRPEDEPTPSYSSLRRIRELGGAYARADAGGEFFVNLPRPGVYYLLLISSNVRRPEEEAVHEMDLSTLDAYFRRPEYLIGTRKYRLTAESFSGLVPIEHDFGLDRR